MTYTPQKPPIAESSEELRKRIAGWGVDLDPKDRPAVPKERFNPGGTGAHWDFPERQIETYKRERSPEHKFLTPVFGTSCPPHGLSGQLRRYAYKKYSEGRAAHWLLLLAADRVDVMESRVQSLRDGHPDNPIAETGVMAEFSHHGFASRFGKKRTDVKHQALDPVIVGAPWLAGLGLAYYAVKAVKAVTRRGGSASR